MVRIYKNSFLFLLFFIPMIVIVRYIHSYTLFHNLVEFFAVFVGVMTFVIARFTYYHTKNNFLLFLGMGYFAISIFGASNTIFFDARGVGEISIESYSLLLFLRMFEAILILISMRYILHLKQDSKEPIEVFILFSVSFLIFALFSIDYFLANPKHFLEQAKWIIEGFNLVVLLSAIFIFNRQSSFFSVEEIYNIFGLAFVFTTLSQIALFFSVSPYDMANLISMVLKFISFWFIFYGAIFLGLEKPFRLMASRKNIQKLEKLLEQDEEIITLYENVFTEMNNGIIITDSHNKIIKVNKAFSKITGFQLSDVFGKKPNIFKSGRQSNEFYQEMWNSIIENGHWEGEIWNRKKYGNIYPQWLSITALKDEKSGEVTNYISSFSDISIIKDSQKALEYMAHHDNLTGLVNRVLVKSHLDNMIKSRKRDGGLGAILYLDLDRFKFVNDTYGHGAGDILLQHVGQRLIKTVRESDIVGRVGGDEFVILLGAVRSEIDVSIVANKIIREISTPFEDVIPDKSIHIGTSIGATIFPTYSDDVDTLIKYSDIAMFESKNRGRNSFSFYNPDMHEDIVEKTIIESDLRSAIVADELYLFYQPQIDTETKLVTSAEALIRWKHPHLGTMPPAKFISVAEESDLIIDIGKWVLFEACSQMVQWREKGINIEKISVNISTIQFMKTDMAKTVKTILKTTGCSAKCLEIEVTESVLIDNKDSMFETLFELGAIGVEFAIDDFGTGYSSLSYIKQLPFHTIKIDRSFVMDTPQSKDDVAITKSVIALGKSFNYKVVAEGVEREDQLSLLKDLKCDLIQGYFYAQPMSAEDFEKFYIETEKKYRRDI